MSKGSLVPRELVEGTTIRRYVFTALVVLVAAYSLTSTVNIPAVMMQLQTVPLGVFLFAMLTYYITVPLRALRWTHLLDEIGAELSFPEVNLLTFLGLFFNTVLPAKFGDVYKANRISIQCDVSRSSVIGTVTILRIIDILLLGVGLLATTVSLAREFTTEVVQIVNGVLLVTVGAVGLLTLLVLFPRSHIPTVVQGYLQEFLAGLKSVASTQTLGPVSGFSAGIWGANIFRMGIIFVVLDLPIRAVQITFIAFLLAFLTGLPYTPAGVGFVEVIGTVALAGLGFTPEMSVAIVLLDRFITVVSVVVTGTIVYLLYRIYADPSRVAD